MNIDDILTYVSAVDLASRGLLDKDDLETVWDTIISDPETAMNQAVALFLGQLEGLGVSWDDVRSCWLSAQDRSR